MARTEQVTQGLVVKQKDQAPNFLPPNNSIKLDMLADEVAAGVIDTGAQTFSGDKTFSDNIVIDGNLTVNGTSTILNITTVEVEDPNVLLNRGGSDATAQGAGLTIDRTGTSGSLIYDSALASKWKAGDLGSESEILTAGTTQTISGAKTFSSNTTINADLLLRDDGNDHYATITVANMSISRIYTIPEAGANAEFVMTQGSQTIAGQKTFSGITTFNDTTLRLQEGGGSPTNFATIVSAALGGDYTVTIPNVGNADFVMTAGNQTIGGDKTFSNNATFNGEVDTNAAHRGGYGLVPVGFIGAYNPGYFTNGANAGFTTVGPAGNTVAQINAFLNAKGWYVCDGSAVSNANSPIWNGANRFLPNLDDSRFLMGSTSAGGSGGSSTTSIAHTHSVTSNVAVGNHTLTAANLPKHTHTINHNHASQVTGAGNSKFYRTVWNVGGTTNSNHQTGYDGGVYSDATNANWLSGDHTHNLDLPNFTGNSGDGGAALTATAITHTVTNNTVTSGGASVSTVSILPTYLTTYFIIRVF